MRMTIFQTGRQPSPDVPSDWVYTPVMRTELELPWEDVQPFLKDPSANNLVLAEHGEVSAVPIDVVPLKGGKLAVKGTFVESGKPAEVTLKQESRLQRLARRLLSDYPEHITAILPSSQPNLH